MDEQPYVRAIGYFRVSAVPDHPKRGKNWSKVILILDPRQSLTFIDIDPKDVSAVRCSITSLTDALGRKGHKYATRYDKRAQSLYVARIR